MDRAAIVDRLNDLIQIAEDRHQSFQQAANEVADERLRSQLAALADTSGGLVRELQARVAEIGGAPEATGTLLGGAQRLFQGLMGAITGRQVEQIIEARARGEAETLRQFAEARQQELPDAVIATLDTHIARIEDDRVRLAALRQAP
jgi:uncharacterized protein (TIGR02284 family)